jgi:SH3-like domain-containing protein
MSPRILSLGLGAALLCGSAQALDYRSVGVPVAICYDAPSTQGKKLFLVKDGMPVEVLVPLEGWTKVRDAEGSICWVERAVLVPRRTLVVTAAVADIRQSPAADAPVLFQAEKWVGLDLLEAGPSGWAKVQHRDGSAGFVRVNQVWGL